MGWFPRPLSCPSLKALSSVCPGALLLHPFLSAPQAQVDSGVVSLPDGGSKLRASVVERRVALARQQAAAEGRVYRYRDEVGVEQVGGWVVMGGDQPGTKGGWGGVGQAAGPLAPGPCCLSPACSLLLCHSTPSSAYCQAPHRRRLGCTSSLPRCCWPPLLPLTLRNHLCRALAPAPATDPPQPPLQGPLPQHQPPTLRIPKP